MKDRARTLVEQSVHALATGKGKEYVTMSERTSNGTAGFVLHASGNLHKGTWT
jgi:hypothetical protein